MMWYVREQEEDIFELDNVLDADKAMRALWTRFDYFTERLGFRR